MRISVVLTTYNQPEQLEKVLWGYAAQRGAAFELVVADDGSAPPTTHVIDRVAREAGIEIVHVWHEDRGFRKTEILNRAILVASGEYLIFSDGDCIPRNDFVKTHSDLAASGSFLSGGYVKLPRDLSSMIGVAEVRSGSAFQAGWLRERGWDAGRRTLRLLQNRALATMLDLITPTRRTWNGHNSSAWKSEIVAANGFDLDMGYGGLDRALGERLNNAGIGGRQVRYRTPCLHLYHDRPYNNPQGWKRNHEIRDRIRRNRETRASQGIAELTDDPSVRVRRPGETFSEPQPPRKAAL